MPIEMARLLEENARAVADAQHTGKGRHQHEGIPEHALLASLYYASAGKTKEAKKVLRWASEKLPDIDPLEVLGKLKAKQNPGMHAIWKHVVELAIRHADELPGIIRQIEQTPTFQAVTRQASEKMRHAGYEGSDGERITLPQLDARRAAFEKYQEHLRTHPRQTPTEKQTAFGAILKRCYWEVAGIPEAEQIHHPNFVPYFARQSEDELHAAIEGTKSIKGGLEVHEFEKAARGKVNQAQAEAQSVVERALPELGPIDAELLSAFLSVGVHQNALACLAHAAWRKARQAESK